jgi:hypothetical protein
MDFQITAIFIIFGLLFILEQFEKKEQFTINKNEGIMGKYPPNPLCLTCNLESNSVTSPYLHANDLGDQPGDLYGKVARSCTGLSGKNYSDLSKPFLVSARSAGRPRQCRRLL